MARLKVGEKPVPKAIRMKKYREELERSGGRRVIVDIEQPAALALETIMAREACTMKVAVSTALVAMVAAPGKRPAAKKKAPAP